MFMKMGGIHDMLMDTCVSETPNRESIGPGRPSVCVQGGR